MGETVGTARASGNTGVVDRLLETAVVLIVVAVVGVETGLRHSIHLL